MDVTLFDYDLPPELIAQQPLGDRAASRMLVLDRRSQTWQHRRFRDLIDYLRPGDCLVLNDTRVLPARLLGHLETGGQVELLLLRELEGNRWEALGQPGRKLRPGAKVSVGDLLTARVLKMGKAGLREVGLEYEGDLRDVLAKIGLTPLPPYIKRHQSADTEQERLDQERYQTVYAQHNGAVAAPTAGLHFDEQMLDQVRAAAGEIVNITMHVGLGTFQPVKVQQVDDHKMHPEWYEVTVQAAGAINEAERVIAVGTTVVRTLETLADENGTVAPGEGWSDLFIYPEYRFKAVDALLTNFHLPRSTLLMMISAFAGRELILAAYQEAIAEGYRFYSYGDCMLIL